MRSISERKFLAVGAAILLSFSLAVSTPAKAAAGVDDVVAGVCVWIITESGKKVLECAEEAIGLYNDLQVQEEAEEQADQQQQAHDQMKKDKDKDKDTIIIPVIRPSGN